VSEQLVEAFSGFYPAWTRWLKATLQDTGVTPARVRLLAVLADGPATTMTALSQALHVSPRNITTLVDALEGEALVRRKNHPSDRRATVVELTDQGAALCEQLWSKHLASAGEVFDVLSPKEQQTLKTTLDRLRVALRERGID